MSDETGLQQRRSRGDGLGSADRARISQSEDIESTLSEGVKEELEAKKPSESEKKQLLREHRHHLVRSTTSELSVEPEVSEGVEATATADVPDIYCFTCAKWIGISGVELRGTPRSKEDAYYLGGTPEDVCEARQTVREGIEDLSYQVLRDVDHIDSLADAYAFVQTQFEKTQVTEKADTSDS